MSMTQFHHAIVWIDHQTATLMHFGPEGVTTEVVHSTHRHEHLHHKANSIDSGRAPQDHSFLQRVGASLASTATILVTGPANAKSELVSFLQAHQPAIAGRVVAVQPLDHPSDGQLEAYARKFFHADERMHLPVGTRE